MKLIYIQCSAISRLNQQENDRKKKMQTIQRLLLCTDRIKKIKRKAPQQNTIQYVEERMVRKNSIRKSYNRKMCCRIVPAGRI